MSMFLWKSKQCICENRGKIGLGMVWATRVFFISLALPGFRVPTDLHVDNFLLIALIYLAYGSVDEHTILPYHHCLQCNYDVGIFIK